MAMLLQPLQLLVLPENLQDLPAEALHLVRGLPLVWPRLYDLPHPVLCPVHPSIATPKDSTVVLGLRLPRPRSIVQVRLRPHLHILHLVLCQADYLRVAETLQTVLPR